MKQIQITPAELRTQAAELNSLRAEYESLFSNLNSVLNRTNDAWSENLSHNFVGKISSTQKSCSSILEALQWGSTAATKSAESFETIDNTLANGLNGNAASDGGSSAGGSNGGGFRGGRIKEGETAPGSSGGGFRGEESTGDTKASWWDKIKEKVNNGKEIISTGVAKAVDWTKGAVSTVVNDYKNKGVSWKIVKTAGAVASGIGAVVSAAAAWGVTGGSAGLAAPAAVLVTAHSVNTLTSSFSDIYNCWFGDKEQVGNVNVLKSLDQKVLGETAGSIAYNVGSLTATIASISALVGKVKQAPDLWKAIKGTGKELKEGASNLWGLAGDVVKGNIPLSHLGAQLSLLNMSMENVNDVSKCFGIVTTAGKTTKKLADAVAEPIAKAINPDTNYGASFVEKIFGKDSTAAKAYKDVKGAASLFEKEDYKTLGDAYKADQLQTGNN